RVLGRWVVAGRRGGRGRGGGGGPAGRGRPGSRGFSRSARPPGGGRIRGSGKRCGTGTAMNQDRPQTGAMTRRQLLQLGGISAIRLGLPELLRAGEPGTRPATSQEKSCIFIVQYGGCSQIDSFDLKPDAPDEI